ncbi:hypothetical protein FFK22_010170 [Mycobacterium sp. KBS0706]|uniref:DUF3592 domain-containing protein n=1 Tax=Mycobacterium sp. KBS0706 TaxID=2578109 RepID=UPI00110F7ABD|nr:DUF3592 domain-containing protein [Mycobacterium sp. KBS0706]TSD88851.1 hypothetical protein FFK22_010170 [Mycobacterium sp. KBS0706]
MIRRLVGVLLLLFGVFLAVGAGKGAWDREQWRQGAVEIQGLVLPPGAGDRSTPALAAAETVVRLGTLRAVYAAVDTGLATVPQPGQRVAVLIDPDQRDRAVLDHPMALWGDQIIAGGLGAVLALVGLVMMRSRMRRPVPAGTAAAAIETVMRQVAARRTEAKPSPQQPPQQQTAASFRVARPAGSGAVIQRMRDSPVTVQRVGEPAVTRIVERPSGVLPILAFAVVVLALVVYLVAAA